MSFTMNILFPICNMSFTMNILFPICVVIIVYLRTRKLSKSQEKLNRQPLEVLYSPDSNDPEVDIVAVHGLGSNVDWSWVWQDKTGQRPRVHWLKDADMLPAVVPNAMILAYNYESRWHANALQTRLQLCCESLVQSLDNFYGQESKRPILFIGHSLGGLVILYGLSYAHSQRRYKNIAENTTGFISIGTPFRGTGMQPIAQLAAWIMAPFGSDWGIIADLGYDNSTLRDEIDKFGALVKKLNMSTYCFFEQFKTDYGKRFGVPGIIKGMVVKEASACVPAWPRASLQTDHLKMNKFAGPNDRGYLAVSAEISKMCEVEEPLFKQATKYLREKCYTESKLRITRLSGAILPIDQCYINLAIVENVHADKSSQSASDQSSPFSFLARQKIETPNENLQVDLADIFNLRGESNVPGNPPRRIIIRGRAGVGKTTLCKKIVHDFNQSTIWKDLFDCILWVPLRNLKTRNGSGYNFEKLFFDEFFTYSGNELGQRFSREIDTMQHHKSVLFILDGWDEVSQLDETDHDMFTFLEELLGLPNVIITSRPSASLPPGIDVHLELETIGFYPEQVDEYILNSRTQYPDEIKSFLQSHQLVQSLARIPIQLDALCHCWKDIEANYGDVKSQTMTSLYQAIQTSLWKKDIPRLKLKSVDGEIIQSSDIKNADQPRVEKLVQRQLHFLEHLAFDGLINDVIEFEPKHLNPVNNNSNYLLLLDSILPYLSFLRTSSPSAQYDDQSYHFIHLTFQEYFAARYFARQWRQGSHLKRSMFKLRKDIKPADFLAKYKYDQRFNVMWRFAAGLLDIAEDEGEHQATCFLKVIEAEPRDLLGPTHQRLVMHCLSEVVSSGGLGFSTYKKHLEAILTQWLFMEIELNKKSSLAEEPEFPEKALENGLKQGSDSSRKAIVKALVRRGAPHDALNAAFSCLNDSNFSKEMKIDILGVIKEINIPLTEDYIRSVAVQLGDDEFGLREPAYLILFSQPKLSRDISQLIKARFKEDMKRLSLDSILGSTPNISIAIQLALAQLENSALPQDLHKGQNEDDDLENLMHDVYQFSRQRRIALRTLREHSVSPIQKLSWFEEHLRACDRYYLRLDAYPISHRPPLFYGTLEENKELTYEVLQIIQRFDLSQETLLLIAKQLRSGQNLVNGSALQILGNRSDLSKEVLLLVLDQLKSYDHTVAKKALQVLRGQSNIPKEVLHASVELFTCILQGSGSDELWEEAVEFLTNQPSLPEEILRLAKAWQEYRDLSSQTGVFKIPEGQSSLPKDTLLLVVSKLKSNEAPTQRAAIECLKGQLALSEDILHLMAEQLRDTNYRIQNAAAEVLKHQTVLSDSILQLIAELINNKENNAREIAVKALSGQVNLPNNILQLIVGQVKVKSYTIKLYKSAILVQQKFLSDEMLQFMIKQLKDEDYDIRSGAEEVLRSRANLSQELLELVADQLLDQTLETQESGLEILADGDTSFLFNKITQVVESQLERLQNRARIRAKVSPILRILAGQSTLSERILQLVAQQPKIPSDMQYAFRILKGHPSLPETVLGLVEKPLCAEKIIHEKESVRKWLRALRILKAQSVLSEERQHVIVECLRTRDHSVQSEVVETLLSRPCLHTGVLGTHLLSFYEALLRRSFSEHLVWISQDSGSYLVKDSRYITWNKAVSSKRELELVQEVQKRLYAEWKMPDKGFSWKALWHSS